MFERICAHYLRTYLGWLVKGIDQEKLNISIWGGDVVLTDLELQDSALDFLELPVQVKRGYLKKLRLSIPWTSVGSSPSIVELDGLYCVAYPSDQFEYDEDEALKQKLAAKVAKLAELNAAETKAATTSGGGGGYMAGMITKIVQNLQLVITNVHIRMEDRSSDPRHPFALGLVIKEVRLESDREAANSTEPDGLIRKSFVIKGFGVYLDSDLHDDECFVRVGPSHHATVLQREMQDLGLAQYDDDYESTGASSAPKQFLLTPLTVHIRVAVDDQMVGGSGAESCAALYADGELPAVMDVAIKVSTLGLTLGKSQYRDLLNCISFLSNYSTISRNRQYRPKVTVSASPSAWWKYAYNATVMDLREKKKQAQWDNVLRTVKDRSRYIALQKRKHAKYAEISSQIPLQSDSAGLLELSALENMFDIEEIVNMRKRADVEVTEEIREYEATQGTSARNDPSGWFSWSYWSGGNGESVDNDVARDPPQNQKPEHGDDEEFEISEEEKKVFFKTFGKGSKNRDKLMKIMAAGSDTRPSLIAEFHLASVEVQLGSNYNQESYDSGVMQLKLATFRTFVKTINDTTIIEASLFDLTVHDMSSNASDECKAIVSKALPFERDDESAIQNDPGVFKPENALLVTKYVAVSPTTESDAHEASSHVELKLKPLEVVVSFPFLSEVGNFFSSGEEVNLDSFVFAAAERAEALRQVSAASAHDMLSSSSEMTIDIELSPPAILIPADVTWSNGLPINNDHGRDLILFANLGHLTVRSGRDTAVDTRIGSGGVSIEVTPFHLLSREYDRFEIALHGTRVIVASRRVPFRHTQVQQEQRLRVIDDIDIDVVMDRCIAPFRVDTPGMRIHCSIPQINIDMSSRKLSQIYKLASLALFRQPGAVGDTGEGVSSVPTRATSARPVSSLNKTSMHLLQRSVGMAIQLDISEVNLHVSSDSQVVLGKRYYSGDGDGVGIVTVCFHRVGMEYVARTYDTSVLLSLDGFYIEDCLRAQQEDTSTRRYFLTDRPVLEEPFPLRRYAEKDNTNASLCSKVWMVTSTSPDAQLCKAGMDVSCKMEALTLVCNLELISVLLRFVGDEDPGKADVPTPAQVDPIAEVPATDGEMADKMCVDLLVGNICILLDYRDQSNVNSTPNCMGVLRLNNARIHYETTLATLRCRLVSQTFSLVDRTEAGKLHPGCIVTNLHNESLIAPAAQIRLSSRDTVIVQRCFVSWRRFALKTSYLLRSGQLEIAKSIFNINTRWSFSLGAIEVTCKNAVNVLWESSSFFNGYDSNLDMTLSNVQYNYMARYLAEIFWYLDHLYEVIWPGSVAQGYAAKEDPDLSGYYTPSWMPRLHIEANNFVIGLPLSSTSNQRAEMHMDRFILLNGVRGRDATMDSELKRVQTHKVEKTVNNKANITLDDEELAGDEGSIEGSDAEFFDSQTTAVLDASALTPVTRECDVDTDTDTEGMQTSIEDIATDVESMVSFESYSDASDSDFDEWQDAPNVSTVSSIDVAGKIVVPSDNDEDCVELPRHRGTQEMLAYFSQGIGSSFEDRNKSEEEYRHRNTRENLDHFMDLTHHGEKSKHPAGDGINLTEDDSEPENSQLLRKMNIFLYNFDITTYLKTPPKYQDKEDDNASDFVGTPFIIPCDGQMCFHMPETIWNGPQEGKLGPMVIGFDFPELNVKMSLRQYCFSLEILSRNLAEDFSLVRPVVLPKAPKIIDPLLNWLECPIQVGMLSIELSDYQKLNDLPPTQKQEGKPCFFGEVASGKIILTDFVLTYASTNIGSMLVSIGSSSLDVTCLDHAPRKKYAQQYSHILQVVSPKRSTVLNKGIKIQYDALVTDAGGSGRWDAEGKWNCHTVIDLSLHGVDVVLAPGLFSFLSFFTSADPMDWDGPYPPTPEPVQYTNSMMLLVHDTEIHLFIADDISNPLDVPLSIMLSLSLVLKSDDTSMETKVCLRDLRGFRSDHKFSLVKISNEDLIQPFNLDLDYSQRERPSPGVKSKSITSIALKGRDEFNALLSDKNYHVLMNITSLLGSDDHQEEENEIVQPADLQSIPKPANADVVSIVSVSDQRGGETEKFPVLASSTNVYVFLPAVHVTIVKNVSYYLPLVQLSVWRLNALHQEATLNQGKATLKMEKETNITLALAVDFFNQGLSLWEPLVELWNLKCNVKEPLLLEGDDTNQVASETGITVSATNMLNINITPVCMLTLSRTMGVFDVSNAKCKNEYIINQSFISHEIKNSLGGDVRIWEENIELCPEMATVDDEKNRRRDVFWAKCNSLSPNTLDTFVHVSNGASKALESKSFNSNKMGARLSWAGDLYSAQDYTSSRVIAFRYIDHITNVHYDLPPVPIDHVGKSIRSIHDDEKEKAARHKNDDAHAQRRSQSSAENLDFIHRCEEIVCEVYLSAGKKVLHLRSTVMLKNMLPFDVEFSTTWMSRNKKGRPEEQVFHCKILKGETVALPLFVLDKTFKGSCFLRPFSDTNEALQSFEKSILPLHRIIEFVERPPSHFLLNKEDEISDKAKKLAGKYSAHEELLTFRHASQGTYFFRSCSALLDLCRDSINVAEINDLHRKELLISLLPQLVVENLLPCPINIGLDTQFRGSSSQTVSLLPAQCSHIKKTEVPFRRDNSSLPCPVEISLPCVNGSTGFVSDFVNAKKNGKLDFQKPLTIYVPLLAKTDNGDVTICVLSVELEVIWNIHGYTLQCHQKPVFRGVPLRMRVYCRYWIFNRTDKVLQFNPRQKVSKVENDDFHVFGQFEGKEALVKEESSGEDAGLQFHSGLKQQKEDSTFMVQLFDMDLHQINDDGRMKVRVVDPVNGVILSKWSKQVPIMGVGVDQALNISSTTRETEYAFGISVQQAPGIFSRTRVVTLGTGHHIINGTEFEVEWSQIKRSKKRDIISGVKNLDISMKGQALGFRRKDEAPPLIETFQKEHGVGKGVVAANSRSHVHWVREGKSQAMSIRINKPGWCWSGEFSIQDVNSFVLQVYRIDHVETKQKWLPVHDHLGEAWDAHDTASSAIKSYVASKFLNVEVKTNDASVLVIITELQDEYPPYKIDNQCTCASLRFVQKDVAASEQMTLPPMTSTPYAWSELSGTKKLLVQAVPLHGPSSKRDGLTFRGISSTIMKETRKVATKTVNVAQNSVESIGRSISRTQDKSGSFDVVDEIVTQINKYSQIIQANIDTGLGIMPVASDSIREYALDEIEQHEDLKILVYRVKDGKDKPPVLCLLRVQVHMEGPTKVLTVTDVPFFRPTGISSLSSEYANVSDRLRRAQGRARLRAYSSARTELSTARKQCMGQIDSLLEKLVIDEYGKRKELGCVEAVFFRIQIIAGRDLAVADLTTSDPFVESWLVGKSLSKTDSPSKIHIPHRKNNPYYFKTKVINATINPVWQGAEKVWNITDLLEDSELQLNFHVWDHDTLSHNDSLGVGEVSLVPIVKEYIIEKNKNNSHTKTLQFWLPLRRSKELGRGEIRIHVQIGPNEEHCTVNAQIQQLTRYHECLNLTLNHLAGKISGTKAVKTTSALENQSVLHSVGGSTLETYDMIEDGTSSLSITGQQLSLVIQHGEKILDPNTAMWLIEQKAMHFTFVSTSPWVEVVSQLKQLTAKRLVSYYVYRKFPRDESGKIRSKTVVGYIEFNTRLSLFDLGKHCKEKMLFAVRRIPRQEAGKAINQNDIFVTSQDDQTDGNNEFVYQHGDFNDDYAKIYAVVSMKGDVRSTPRHYPGWKMEVAGNDDRAAEVGSNVRPKRKSSVKARRRKLSTQASRDPESLLEEYKKNLSDAGKSRIYQITHSLFESKADYTMFSAMEDAASLEIDYQTGFLSTWGLGHAFALGDGAVGLALKEIKFSAIKSSINGSQSILLGVPEEPSTDDDKNMLFLAKIAHIHPDSPAAKHVVNVGDCIVAIGSKIMAGKRLSTVKSLLADQRERPSPFPIRTAPEDIAIKIARAYAEEGMEGIQLLRQQELRKLKEKRAESSNYVGEGATSKKEDWQKTWEDSLNFSATVEAQWGHEIQFDPEKCNLKSMNTSKPRYARLSLYAHTGFSKDGQGSSAGNVDLSLESKHSQDLILPLTYFFGDDPVSNLDSARSEEKYHFDDVLLGQTVLELPMYDDDDETRIREDDDVKTRRMKDKLKTDKYFRNHTQRCPLTLFTNASHAAMGSSADLKTRYVKQMLDATDSGAIYGYAGEVIVDFGWSPVRKKQREKGVLSLTTDIAGIGISVMNATPTELLYLVLQDIFVGYDTYADGRTEIEFKIKHLQIDNQLPLCRYNILLGPRPVAGRVQEKPTVHASAVLMDSDANDGVTNFDTFALAIQALDLKLDDTWLKEFLRFLPQLYGEVQEEANMTMVEDQILTESPVIMECELFVLDLGKDPLFENAVFHTCVLRMDKALTRSTAKVYFRFLQLHPISLNITFSSTGDIRLLGSGNNASMMAIRALVNSLTNMISNIDDAPIRLDSLVIQHSFSTWASLTEKTIGFFVRGVITQVHKILFSVDFLGNPVGLVNSLGSGVISFFYEPAKGFMKSPKDFREGIKKGTQTLVLSSVQGLAHTAGKITETVGRVFAMAAMNDEYIQDRKKIGAKGGPKNMKDAVGQGVKDVANGVIGGVKGIVMDPLRGLQRDGVKGLAVGFVQGIAGVAVKPVAGVLDMLTHTFQGVKNTASAFDSSQRFTRSRLPRFFSRNVLERYSAREAEGAAFMLLREMPGEYVYHVRVENSQTQSSQPQIILITTRELCCLRLRGTDLSRESDNERGLALVWTVPMERIHLAIPRGSCIALREGSGKHIANTMYHASNSHQGGKIENAMHAALSSPEIFAAELSGEKIIQFNNDMEAGHMVEVIQETLGGNNIRTRTLVWDWMEEQKIVEEEIKIKLVQYHQFKRAENASISAAEYSGDIEQKDGDPGAPYETEDIEIRKADEVEEDVLKILDQSGEDPLKERVILDVKAHKVMPTSGAIVSHTTELETRGKLLGKAREVKFTMYSMKMTGQQRPYTVQWTVNRRFSQFRKFRAELKKELRRLGGGKLPSLPMRRLAGSTSESVVRERVIGMNQFMSKIYEIENLKGHSLVLDFVCENASDIEVD